jgi:hypothetical protein
MGVAAGEGQEKYGQSDEKEQRGEEIKEIGGSRKADGFAAGEIGQSFGAKKQKDDHENDDQIRPSKIEKAGEVHGRGGFSDIRRWQAQECIGWIAASLARRHMKPLYHVDISIRAMRSDEPTP